jgi:hypothetical protein
LAWGGNKSLDKDGKGVPCVGFRGKVTPTTQQNQNLDEDAHGDAPYPVGRQWREISVKYNW